MRSFMTEDELQAADISKYHEIFVAMDTANYRGIQVKEDRRLLPFTAADSPGTVREVNQLFVVVEDPENPETVARIKTCINKKLAR